MLLGRILLSGVLIPLVCQGQPHLKPSIGLFSVPSATDPICDIPLRLGGNFDQIGYQVGDTMPDFTLYAVNGDSFHLGSTLQQKPVVLITCSYTCPVFRQKVPAINLLQSTFGDQVAIALIYTVEAHPVVDVSPYFGFVNPTEANYQQGILYRQPATYGDRLVIVSDMIADLPLLVPVYLDGPCNNFWIDFECGPVSAYLIGTDGVLHAKHGWFNSYPHNMADDIEELLGLDSTGQTTTGGSFVFYPTDAVDRTILPGEEVFFHGMVKNLDSLSGMLLAIEKRAHRLPSGWWASLCTDVCYSPAEDSVTLYLAPGDSTIFTLHVTTTAAVDSAEIEVLFSNLSVEDNLISQIFRLRVASPRTVDMAIMPNPCMEQVIIFNADSTAESTPLQVLDVQGQIILSAMPQRQSVVIDASTWPSGMYLIRWKDREGKLVKL